MKERGIYFLAQLASMALIWLFVGSITYWIVHLIYISWQLHDALDASLGISIVAIPVFLTLASILTYVFAGLRRGGSEEEAR